MARSQGEIENKVAWSARISSGEGAGATATVYGVQITLGSSEDDTIVLPGHLGAARLAIQAQPFGGAKVTAGRESLIVNGKTIFPDKPAIVSAPLTISFTNMELEVSRLLSDKQGLPINGSSRRLASILIPALALGLLGAVGYVVLQSTSLQANQSARTKAISDSGLQPTAGSKRAEAGPRDLVSNQLMTMGLSDAISATEENDMVILTGSVTAEELKVWTDLEPGLKLLAAPKKLVVNVVTTPAVTERQGSAGLISERSSPPRPARLPSLSGDVAAIDFARNQLLLKNGNIVRAGGELSDGWTLLRLGSEGISIEKDGQSATIPLGAISQ
jgi:hypothetical protein